MPQMTAQDIIQLATVLEPFGVATVEGIVWAIKGSGADVDAADADLVQLVTDALAAKAEADRAASGNDPQ